MENNSAIRDIYTDFIQTPQYEQSPEIARLIKNDFSLGLSEKAFSAICDHEEQGFIMGYQYAFKHLMGAMYAPVGQ